MYSVGVECLFLNYEDRVRKCSSRPKPPPYTIWSILISDIMYSEHNLRGSGVRRAAYAIHAHACGTGVITGYQSSVVSQWVPGIACLRLLRAVITSTPFHASFFTRLLENHPRTPCLFSNCFTDSATPAVPEWNLISIPSQADTREKFLFLLHVVGYKSWSVGLLFLGP